MLLVPLHFTAQSTNKLAEASAAVDAKNVFCVRSQQQNMASEVYLSFFNKNIHMSKTMNLFLLLILRELMS